MSAFRDLLIQQNDTPQWMKEAVETYGIPLQNLKDAYAEWSNVQYAFHANSEGKYGYLRNNSSAYIETNYAPIPNKCCIHTEMIIYSVITSGTTGIHNAMFGCRNATTSSLSEERVGLWIKNDNTIRLDSIDDTQYTAAIKLAKPLSIDIIMPSHIVNIENNDVMKSYNGSQTKSSLQNKSVYMIGYTTTPGPNPIGNFGCKNHFCMEDGICKIAFVPFYDKDTDTYCMLDLVEYKKYFNANTSGSFTYSLE